MLAATLQFVIQKDNHLGLLLFVTNVLFKYAFICLI